MELETLRDLWLMHIAEIYDAEQQLVEALPEVAQAATDPDLKAGLEKHLAETMLHVQRLEDVATSLGSDMLQESTCHGMEGLLMEAKNISDTEAPVDIIDAGIIAAVQKVEHYEIVTYATLVEWAKLLDMDEAAKLLGDTLGEEKEADALMNKVAGDINRAAANQ